MKKILTICIIALFAIGINAQDVTFEWAKQMGGAGSEFSSSLVVDASGNIYTTGRFSGTADFDPGADTFNLTSDGGTVDIFVSKLDASGNFLWAKRFGGIFYDEGNSIAVDASGNVYTTGRFHGTVDFDPGSGIFNLTSPGSSMWNQEIFISKLDASGNFVWAIRMGGNDTDWGNSIAVDASSNVYTTGAFYITADFDPGPGTYNLTSAGGVEIFISKLDASGNFVWAKQFAGPISYDEGHSLALDAAGNVYTTGRFGGTVDFDPGAGAFNLTTNGPDDSDIYISKLDASGNFVWAKHMEGTDTGQTDRGHSIVVDASGNVYTTGRFAGTVDFDPGAGTFNLTAAAGYSDIFISKLNASGNFVWAIRMDGNTGESNSIAVDGSGNVYTTGSFGGTVDFDPGAGIFNLTSAGIADIFISKLDASGNLVWAMQFGGIDSLGGFNYDLGTSIELDASGKIHTTGRFNGTADFDPGTATFNLISSGVAGIFIQKLNQSISTVGITENDFGSDLTVYPNPTTGVLTIGLGKQYEYIDTRVSDVSGRIVSSKEHSRTEQIDVEINGAQGYYFVEIITSDSKRATIKVLKE